MAKHVHFSTASAATLSPHNDAALIMLDLHNGSRGSTSPTSKGGVKRKFCDDTSSAAMTLAHLVSPNEEDLSKYVRAMSMPAPPFLEDDRDSCCDTTTIQPDDVGEGTTNVRNPLDLLSTVSLQLTKPKMQSAKELFDRPSPSTQDTVPSQIPTTNSYSECDSKNILVKGYKMYSNGSIYLGHFLNTSRHGFGICYYPDGHVYTGMWNNGKRCGVGKMTYGNGNSYEGTWLGDVQMGCGSFYYTDGSVDVALWKGTKSIHGVHWDKDRKKMWRLSGGVKGEAVGKGKALQNGLEVGVTGVPEIV